MKVTTIKDFKTLVDPGTFVMVFDDKGYLCGIPYSKLHLHFADREVKLYRYFKDYDFCDGTLEIYI